MSRKLHKVFVVTLLVRGVLILSKVSATIAGIEDMSALSSRLRSLLILVPVIGLALGFALRPFASTEWSGSVWATFTLPVLVTFFFDIASSLRRGDVGLDIDAALSMSAALVFGEELAAMVVALMYSGGQF